MLAFTCIICIARLPYLLIPLHFFGSTYDASALHKLTTDRSSLIVDGVLSVMILDYKQAILIAMVVVRCGSVQRMWVEVAIR